MRQKAIAYLLPPSINLPDRIDLGEGTIIRRLTSEEREEKKQTNILAMRDFDFQFLLFVIETYGEYDGNIPWTMEESEGEHPYKTIEQNFDLVVLVLRLFKTGIIGYNEFDLVHEMDEFGHTIEGTISRITSFMGDHQYKLEAQEIPLFIEFYNRIKSLNKINFMNTALERFQRLYERDRLEDRLIDLFVAFESLFLKADTELTYRLSTSIAMYLEDSSQRRKEVFEKVKKGYSLRSKIVHGAEVDQQRLKESYEILEEYLRRCLIKILEGKQGLEKRDLLRYVEERIFE